MLLNRRKRANRIPEVLFSSSNVYIIFLLLVIFFTSISSGGMLFAAENTLQYRGELDELAFKFYQYGDTEEVLLELKARKDELQAGEEDYNYFSSLAEIMIFWGEVKEVAGRESAEERFAQAYELAQEAIKLESTARANRQAAEALSYLFNYRSTFFIIRNAGRAEDYLDKAEELAPQDYLTMLIRGNYYINAPRIAGGDRDKGRELFAEIRESDHPIFELAVLNTLTQMYEADGNAEKLSEHREAARKLFPESPWIDKMPLRIY